MSCLIIVFSSGAIAQRIKDLTSIQGVRTNQLIGYGLVVGLNGTGDKTNQVGFTTQSFKSLLNKFGIRIPPNLNLQTNTIAAVMVTADLPAFAKPGQQMDITVSAIGNAKSLRGGTLLMTPLRGADEKVYAMAQGNLITSGFGLEGSDGSKITQNIPSVGRIPNGATVEEPAPTVLSYADVAVFNLNRPDFTTAVRMVQTINHFICDGIAKAVDAGSIVVQMPKSLTEQVALMAKIENLFVQPGHQIAKIIINARTGTVIIGENVRVKPTVISHGNLTLTVTETPTISQPNPFTKVRNATVVDDSELQVAEGNKQAFLFDPGPSLEDIVESINRIGASPSDLVAILDSLRQAGAIDAEIEVI